MEEITPLVSVIIPYYNCADTLERTLASVKASDYPNIEIVTIDDRSTDDSSKIISKYNGIHISMIRRSGAAVARNVGAANCFGSLYFFVDADVTVQPGTISEAVRTLQNEKGLAACFGEYTPLPVDRNFATVYKNLVHHFTHQTSREQARTFWCGCGMIRRQAFERVRGFDESFIAASVEDIDLGYRLSALGMKIRLNKKLQVTHGKKYTFFSLIKSDFFNRAIPWTKLMAERNIFTADLNLQWVNVASGLMLFFATPILFAAGYSWGLRRIWFTPLLLVVLYLLLNRKIFLFVIRQKSFWFFIPFAMMYTLTYVYSSIGFAVGILAFIKDGVLGKRKKK